MKKFRAGVLLVIILVVCTCIDPYTPELRGYESLLVVEGLITDANTSYTIKLSRTFQKSEGKSSEISDATVFITDDKGNVNYLISKGNGIYKSDTSNYGEKSAGHILLIFRQKMVKYMNRIAAQCCR